MPEKKRNYPEIIQLSEEMLLNILRGKDLHIILNAENEEKRQDFIFRGPWDGVFLTHEEITNMQYESEMGVFKIIQKLRNSKPKEFNVKSKKGI